MNRQKMFQSLVAINLVLLVVLGWKVAGSSSTAMAQAPGSGQGNYLSVTAAVSGQEWDVLYVLDLDSRQLHAFAPTNVQNRQLQYFGSRDLKADMGR